MSIFVRYEVIRNGTINEGVMTRSLVLDSNQRPRPVYRILRGTNISDTKTTQICHAGDYVLQANTASLSKTDPLSVFSLFLVSGPTDTLAGDKQLSLVPCGRTELFAALSKLDSGYPELSEFLGYQFLVRDGRIQGPDWRGFRVDHQPLSRTFDQAGRDIVIEMSSVLPVYEGFDGKYGYCGLRQQQSITRVLGALPLDELDQLYHMAGESPRNAIESFRETVIPETTHNDALAPVMYEHEMQCARSFPTWYILGYSGNIVKHSGDPVHIPRNTAAVICIHKGAFLDPIGRQYGMLTKVYVNNPREDTFP